MLAQLKQWFGTPVLVYSHQSWPFNRKREIKETEVSEKPSDRYGLEIVLDPLTESTNGDVANIIFVHGLGGSARGTWTYEPGAKFWPSWLHHVKGLQNARVMTFGYDADWHRIWNPKNLLDVSDFATQLLDHLFRHYSKYPKDIMNVCNHDVLLNVRYPLYSLHTAWVAWLLKRYGTHSLA